MNKPAPTTRTLRIVTGETPLTPHGEGGDADLKWEVRCLDMSISGFGPTPLAAQAELFGLLHAQTQFASQENMPEILDNPDTELIEKYASLTEEVVLVEAPGAYRYPGWENPQPPPPTWWRKMLWWLR